MSLFDIASRVIQTAARTAFEQSAFGRLLADVRKIGTHGNSDRLAELLGKHGSLSPSDMLKGLLGADFAGLVNELGSAIRGGGAGRSVVDAMLSAMGPSGKLIRTLADSGRRATLQNDLKAAAGLVQSFGGLVIGKPGRASLGDAMAGVDQVIKRLESYGFKVMPPGTRRPGEGRSRPGTQKRPAAGRRTVEVTMQGGGTRSFPKDHPIVTGAMVKAPRSTNVYAFGYDLTNAFLYVRFQSGGPEAGAPRGVDKSGTKRRPTANEPKGPKDQASAKGGKGGQAGPLYRYAGVTPDEFLTLLRLKDKGGGRGPGKWVWDVLRIRGTVSGHRKDYALAGIIGDYVPRKATVMPAADGAGLEEWYVQRTTETTSGRTVTSKLPNTRVTGPRGGFESAPPRRP